ncbi:hypothetical protein, partial [Streptomyces sp. SID8380]
PPVRIGIIGAPDTLKEPLARTMLGSLRLRGISARQPRPTLPQVPLGPGQTEPDTRALICRALAAEAVAESGTTKFGPVRAVLTRSVTWTVIAHYLVAHQTRTGTVPRRRDFERLVRLALAPEPYDYLLLTPCGGSDRTEGEGTYGLRVHRRLVALLEQENVPHSVLPPGDDMFLSAIQQVPGLPNAPVL